MTSLRTFSLDICVQGRPLVSTEAFPLNEGGITFLFGESGIGKSLLCKAVYGLLDDRDFNIQINGKPYAEHLESNWTKGARKGGFFVFQEPSTHLNPLLRIQDQLNEGDLSQHIETSQILERLWDTSDPAVFERVLGVFPKPFRPSGGEKQRALLAMAFKKIALLKGSAPVSGSALFIFDEPTGSLDNRYRNLFLEYLFQCYEEHRFTVIVVTHDYSIISEINSRYRRLVPSVSFLEVTREKNSKVTLRRFLADDYLDWLKALSKPATSRSSMDGSGEAVLQFSSHFTVFSRSLCLYRDAEKKHPADLIIRKGDMVYIKAQSGVGKTTLAKIIMGLYRAETFSMKLCGHAINERTEQMVWRSRIWGKRAGMVFQHADEALNLEATVYESFVGLPLKQKPNQQQVIGWLKMLFAGEVTADFLDKKCAYLSGGQKQRLNLLRALVLDVDLLILDEPLNGLDFESVKKVIEFLMDRQKKGKSMLMISHNEEIFTTLIDVNRVWYLGETYLS